MAERGFVLERPWRLPWREFILFIGRGRGGALVAIGSILVAGAIAGSIFRPDLPGGGSDPDADVWVTTSGNDGTCARGDDSLPCATFQKAADIAQSGDLIEVAAGNYSGQTILDIHKTLTLKAASGTQPNQPNAQMVLQCTTGITIDNIDAQQLLVSSGNDMLTIKNSDFGGGTWTTGVEADPVVISGDVLHACAQGFTNTDILLDNIYVHDYFWNQDPGTGPHPDCMQLYGGIDGFVMQNSTFERCVESFIGAFPDFGELHNITIQDSEFLDLDNCTGNAKGADCTFFTTQWSCDEGFTASNGPFTWLRTTWTPDVTSGMTVGPRTDCPDMTVSDSHFQHGPTQDSCDAWNAIWNDTVVWESNNTFDAGGCIAP